MRDLSYSERLGREAACLKSHWDTSPRWRGIERTYTAEDVIGLRGTITVEHTLARLGADRLWTLMWRTPFVAALGAMTGGQALQMVKAGLDAIYVSGWQVAADANLALHTYADQIAWANEETDTRWIVPIMADAEAGFGGPLNAFETMKAMIEAGASAVHFEDQLAGEKKCGHLGGKVLVPTAQFIRTLTAARLAADVLDVPTILVARTDAGAATLVTSDVDERDRPFLTGQRTAEGYFLASDGLDAAIARGLAYAPYADVLWCETSTPDLDEAERFAEVIHARFPGKLLAYNCSPSFNWKRHLDAPAIRRFQDDLGTMGYAFQFVTLAGFHALNASMFELARGYQEAGMSAYVELQDREFELGAEGYTATRHQAEVGTGYFDRVSRAIGGDSPTLALPGSTEAAQFEAEAATLTRPSGSLEWRR